MADVPGKFFSATKVRTGVSPSSPGSLVGEPLPPVNPPGTSLNSVGLTMPSAFTVSNSPLTSNGTIGVAGAGTVGQYIRGDGSLADFPESSGGGSSVSYYLNGSVNQGTIGGVAYKELNKVPVLGAGTDFTIAADGYIASFLTDAGDPNLLEIPAGNWNFETYFSASSSGGTPSFYVELYKYNGTTFTLIASSSSAPEFIAFGTITTPYFSSLAVPTTVLALTDRLAVRYYVTHSGRTITLHTEDNHLCQIITTFTTGITALNGLTAQVQNLAVGTSGTDFAIASATATHTFNLPTASATNRGALSSADWSLFTQAYNDKINSAAVTGTTTKTLTLTQQDGGTITASWTDINTDAVLSVFGRTGAVIAVSGDYTTAQVTESGNLYYTDARSRAALSFVAGSGAYNSSTGVITIPTNNNQIINGAGYITSAALAGYVPTSRTITINGTTQDLSANRTFNVGTVTSVAALTLGTSGTDLSSSVANGTTTPVITLNVPTASATNRGALTAADWTTFNNKQNALTNPVTGTGTTNYLPKFTGASAIGNSQIFDDGTNVGIGTILPGSLFDVTNTLGTAYNPANTLISGQTMRISNLSTSSSIASTLLFIATGGGGGNGIGTISGVSTGTGSLALTFGTRDSGGSVTEQMRITSDGKILVGTTDNNGARFQVNGTATFSGISTFNNGTNSTNGIKIISTLSSSVFTGGLEFIRETVAAGSKIEPLRNAIFGGVGIKFLVTANNLDEISGSYTSALEILRTQEAIFISSVTASSFIKSGGTSSQFLKADGSVDSTSYVPTSRTITINGTSQDLSANRTFNVGTVTSVTASSPLFSSGGATPNITIQQASGSQNGFLSSTDWTTFNNKAPSVAGGYLPLSGGTLTGTTTMQGAIASLVLKSDGAGVPLYIYGRNSDNSSAIFFYNETGVTLQNYILSSPTDFRIVSQQNAPISFVTNAASSTIADMSITAGGNVLVGTTTDTLQKLQVNGDIYAEKQSGNASLFIKRVSLDTKFEISVQETRTRIRTWSTANDRDLYFDSDQAGTTRMAITSGGNVLIGVTTEDALFGITIRPTGTNMVFNSLNSAPTIMSFQYNSIVAGSITRDTTNTSFNTSSDYRLKTDLKDFNGLNLLNQIKIYDFAWKTNNKRMFGVLAHELQEVISYAVYGNKDEENTQQVDYSKLVPVMVKAIQELKQEIDTLKN